MDSNTARMLPFSNGETLVCLKLRHVPHNFSWHHFRYDSSALPIVFPRLTKLAIGYTDYEPDLTEDETQ
ncbi:hypothetical protein GGH92_009997, partial [Coemansia sp. RSA 2673]